MRIRNRKNAIKNIFATGIASAVLAHSAIAADGDWAKNTKMSGLLETEYASSTAFSGTSSADFTVPKLEVLIESKLNEKYTANVLLLHEEDSTQFQVDAAWLDFALKSFDMQLGRIAVPFGSFDTYMLADPVTLKVAETKESVILLSKKFGDIEAAAYLFNGSTKKTGGNEAVDQMGFRVAYSSDNLSVGVDYLNNIGDSDTIGTKIGANIANYVAGQTIFARYNFGSNHLIFEHVMTGQFAAAEVAFKGVGAKVTATNIEFAHDMKLAGMNSSVAVGMQSTAQAIALTQPLSKLMLALNMEVASATMLGFEYASSTDYAVADGGTGKSGSAYTVKLAVEF